MNIMKRFLSWLSWLNPLNLFWIVDPCGQTLLETEAKCFRELSATDKDAAIVWYMWKEAITNGFSSDIDDLLDAAACFAAEPPEMLHAMEVEIFGNAAVAAGASLSVTLAEAVEGIKCLRNVDPQKIQALKILLLCKNNAAIS